MPNRAHLCVLLLWAVGCSGNSTTSPSTPGGATGTTTSASGTAAVPTAQRDFLVALYNSTNGASWTVKTNWTNTTSYTADTDPCGAKPWFGVTCTGGSVTSVLLAGNNLTGTLPNFTGMASLQVFDIGPNAPVGINQVSGQIPSLSGLSALRVFKARSNVFTGPIPSLSGLPLQTFDVGNNKLSGPIPSLGGLSALQTFMADNNSQLTGPIPGLSGLTALQLFSVSHTGLTGAIPSLSGLSALQEATDAVAEMLLSL